MSTPPPPFATEPAPYSLPNRTQFASRWRRSFALLIDGVILGIAASIVCIPFFNQLTTAGIWGRILGFVVGVSYFALFESRVGHGQTPAKRLLGIQVVDRFGKTLSVEKATLRAAIFSLPFFLNNLPLSVTRTPELVNTILSIIIFILVCTTYYLLLFNGVTRQGLHDLSVGSYVVDSSEEATIVTGPIWQRHWLILGSSMLFLGLLLAIAVKKLKNTGPFPQLLQDVSLLENMHGVERAGVQDLYVTSSQNGKSRISVLTIYWLGAPDQQEAAANNAALLLLQSDPRLKTYDKVRVVMIRGYDIGIASRWNSTVFEHTPKRWINGVGE